METRPVLRIFISSTAIDLTSYRDKVRDAVLGLDNLPIAMETFSAKPDRPAAECMHDAAQADAVICVVGHRYGYVPPRELGGDGEKSITWLEVSAARQAGKPVFAFIVDDKAPWTEPEEQDRLKTEPPEKYPEIIKAVQNLRAFKAYLAKEFTVRTFQNPDHLATQVAIAIRGLTPATTSRARLWRPLFCHALQPAQHFRGRAARLEELKGFLESPVTPDRVVSVVAAGGTGKTALVDKALHEVDWSGRAGLFVWSFYEDPHTDAFLRAAYVYFTGDTGAPTAGMLERLQIALAEDVPHVLVLDGLERVQSEGGHKRRGELEDLQLKRLVKALAGGVGNARALLTSRFPMADLEGWNGAGHKAILLDDLERPAALDVLRAWNVKGDDARLTALLEPLNIGGTYHALSVAVLGSYIGNFGAGDPARAPRLSLEEAGEGDPKARKLRRILEEYARALTPAERDLLARLALFPRGVRIEYLGWIVQAGGNVAGALIGQSDRQLVQQLERLRQLGLVFHYQTGAEAVYSAHPFLRDHFRTTLQGAKEEDVHESVRAKLAPSLETRPKEPAADSSLLDRYEFLIEQSLLAGRVQEAFDLYWHGMGCARNLALAIGDNGRGLRILERFFPQDHFALRQPLLSPKSLASLVNDVGLFAAAFGDLPRAENAFSSSQALYAADADAANESRVMQNLAQVALLVGRFQKALEHSQRGIELAETAQSPQEEANCLSYRATAQFALGSVAQALADFAQAAALKKAQLSSVWGILEAECNFSLGDVAGALSQTRANLETSQRYDWATDICRSNALLARFLAPDDLPRATQHLTEARAFAERSGAAELQLPCFQAACELYRHSGNLAAGAREGAAGILLADTCGFGKYSIDLRLSLADAFLAAGQFKEALQRAREALERSEHPGCQYAWGQADGLHFCGLAHWRLGEKELARQRLTAALEIREKIRHGRLAETRRALAELDGA